MVHSTEWTTGSRLCGAFDSVSGTFRGASGPLDGVVHWLTTFRAFDPISSFFQGASGPLDGVVHWLTAFRAFDLVSALFPGASGPLDGVVHWLAVFRAFGLVSALSRGASGPLDGVDHWLATLRQLCLSFRLSPSLLIRLPPLFLASHQLFISSFRAKRLLFGYLYMKIHFHAERRMRHATADLGFLLLSAAESAF